GIQWQTAPQKMAPASQPWRRRRFHDDSRAHATSNGASATGASQVHPNRGKRRISRRAELSVRAKFTVHHFGHVGTAHQRSAENHFESERQSVFVIGVELRWCHVFGYPEIAARG